MMQDGADDFNIIIYAPLDRGTDRLSDWLTDCLTNWNIETAVSEWVKEGAASGPIIIWQSDPVA